MVSDAPLDDLVPDLEVQAHEAHIPQLERGLVDLEAKRLNRGPSTQIRECLGTTCDFDHDLAIYKGDPRLASCFNLSAKGDLLTLDATPDTNGCVPRAGTRIRGPQAPIDLDRPSGADIGSDGCR